MQIQTHNRQTPLPSLLTLCVRQITSILEANLLASFDFKFWFQCSDFMYLWLLNFSHSLSRSSFWNGQPLGHHKPYRIRPQHSHPPDQAQHTGPLRWLRKPRRNPGRSVMIRFSVDLLFWSLLWSALIYGSVIFRRFWVLQQTYHSNWNCANVSTHGLSISASSVTSTCRRVAASRRSQLPLLAAGGC